MSTMTSELRPPAPVDKEHKAAVRAGVFIIVAILAMGAVIAVVGNAHRVFDRSSEYTVHFSDVEGLKLDSPVRLGGLTVGSVKEISFATALDDTRVLVRLKVANEFTSRVRTDSIARIASRGLLGDKTVDISIGSGDGKPMASGAELTAGVGGDISSVLKASSEVVSNVVTISTDVRKAVAAFTSPEVRNELTGAISSLHDILGEVATGQGVLHRVIYDPKTGADVSALVADATQVAHRLDAAIGKADAMLGEVQNGSGTAHSLLYGPEGRQALQELSKTAGEVTTLIAEVRSSKNAAAHELLFGESRALVDDLSTSATNLKNITTTVAKGEGSLGALISDPTAYEDLKTILGNVKRNRVLRELVRMTVSNRGEYEDTGKQLTPVKPEEKQP